MAASSAEQGKKVILTPLRKLAFRIHLRESWPQIIDSKRPRPFLIIAHWQVRLRRDRLLGDHAPPRLPLTVRFLAIG